MPLEKIVIHERKCLRGEVTLPGDKSISHRAIIFSALSSGTVIVSGLSSGEDNRRTAKMFELMGVTIKKKGPSDCVIQGRGLHGLKEPQAVLYAGNSGTTMRLMAGVLSGQPFFSVMSGDDSLNARPMQRVVAPLRLMGAQIQGRDDGSYAPLAIKGGNLCAEDFAIPVASAQVKSALLLAGFYAQGTTVVREPVKSRDHTERMLQFLGVPVVVNGTEVSISGGAEIKPGHIAIPGDISSAAFFIVAGLLAKDSAIVLRGVGVNPTRTGIIDILQNMGADIVMVNMREISGEPVADIEVRTSRLKGIAIGGAIIPRLIDELPVIAVAAAFAEGTTVIRDASELRVKESDRIAALCAELKKLGAHVEEREDGMVIQGREQLSGAVCTSHGDHRVAMSLAVAGLGARGETVVEDCACIKTSFPQFMEKLKSIMQ